MRWLELGKLSACGARSVGPGRQLWDFGFSLKQVGATVLSKDVTLATNFCLVRLLAVVWVLLKEVETFVARIELSTIW